MTEVEKALRIAVYGGLLGSLFATIGWLLWLGHQVSHEHWVELVASAVVGAGVGWSYEWLKHYAHTARREQFGELSLIEDTRPDRLKPAHYFRAIFTGAAFAFLFCEHFISELATAVLVPFLVSLVTLFAAGACFARAFCNRNTP